MHASNVQTRMVERSLYSLRYLFLPQHSSGCRRALLREKLKCVLRGPFGRVMHICLLPRFIHACTSSAHAAACRLRLSPARSPARSPRRARFALACSAAHVWSSSCALRRRAHRDDVRHGLVHDRATPRGPLRHLLGVGGRGGLLEESGAVGLALLGEVELNTHDARVLLEVDVAVGRLGTRPLDHVVHRLLDVRVLIELARGEQRGLQLVLLDHAVAVGVDPLEGRAQGDVGDLAALEPARRLPRLRGGQHVLDAVLNAVVTLDAVLDAGHGWPREAGRLPHLPRPQLHRQPHHLGSR
mmetsp:Transcript_25389/g.64343  ORF Transcript_25389/g.64343 Transcript_25389/m.64343 type:complete len:299 (-) Transcript_25389:27-923(-)